MISSAYIESACGIITNSSNITCISSAQYMSGSLFLYSLLDNHPDLHTNPHCINQIIPYEDLSKQFNFPEQLKVLLNNDSFFNTSNKSSNTGVGLHDLGKTRNDFLVIDKKKFEEFLLAVFSKSKINIKNFILAVILAYEYLISGKIKSTNNFIIYTHDPVLSHKILEVLGKSKIIFTLLSNFLITFTSLNKENGGPEINI